MDVEWLWIMHWNGDCSIKIRFVSKNNGMLHKKRKAPPKSRSYLQGENKYSWITIPTSHSFQIRINGFLKLKLGIHTPLHTPSTVKVDEHLNWASDWSLNINKHLTLPIRKSHAIPYIHYDSNLLDASLNKLIFSFTPLTWLLDIPNKGCHTWNMSMTMLGLLHVLFYSCVTSLVYRSTSTASNDLWDCLHGTKGSFFVLSSTKHQTKPPTLCSLHAQCVW